MCWYQISTWYQLLLKFGVVIGIGEGKKLYWNVSSTSKKLPNDFGHMHV